MNMTDLIIKYKGPQYDLSCSEAILYASNDRYGLNLDKSHFYMMAPFSGGMLSEDVCGIASAGLAVIGILFTDNVAHQTEDLREITNAFLKRIETKLKSINCFTLKELHRDEVTGCTSIIIKGAQILEEVIGEYESKIRFAV